MFYKKTHVHIDLASGGIWEVTLEFSVQIYQWNFTASVHAHFPSLEMTFLRLFYVYWRNINVCAHFAADLGPKLNITSEDEFRRVIYFGRIVYIYISNSKFMQVCSLDCVNCQISKPNEWINEWTNGWMDNIKYEQVYMKRSRQPQNGGGVFFSDAYKKINQTLITKACAQAHQRQASGAVLLEQYCKSSNYSLRGLIEFLTKYSHEEIYLSYN